MSIECDIALKAEFVDTVMQTAVAEKEFEQNMLLKGSIRLLAVQVQPIALQSRRNQWWTLLSKRGLLPVVGSNRQLEGVLRQDFLQSSDVPMSLVKAEQLMSSIPTVISPEQSIAEGVALFEQFNLSLIPIVDAQGRYTGECASYTQWYRLQHGLLRPLRVGGFATPLGVYLTSGVHSGGAGWQGVVLTGVLFGAMVYALDWVALLGFCALATLFPALNLLPKWQQWAIQGTITLMGLFAVLRFSPLSGLHAAEHKTVSAIEQGLPLTPDAVRPQPREHNRCGTNLMVLLSSVQCLIFSLWVLYTHVNLLGLLIYTAVWCWVTWKYWHPVGLWVQGNFTTKEPSAEQLLSGIRAGEILLSKFSLDPHPAPSILQRLWGSGLIYLLLSSMLTVWLLEQAVRLYCQLY